MELGEGLKIMKKMLDDGNHLYLDYMRLLSFMFTFLNYSHDEDRNIDYETIQFAYNAALKYLKDKENE